MNMKKALIIFLLFCGTLFGGFIYDHEKFTTGNTWDIGEPTVRGRNLYFVLVDANTLTDGTLSVASGSITSGVNATFSGTITAEQLTSTDDITMQGHSFTMGDGGPIASVIKYLGAGGSESFITFSGGGFVFTSEAGTHAEFGRNVIVQGTSQLRGIVSIGNAYDLPSAGGSANFLVKTDGSAQWGYVNPARTSDGEWGFWELDTGVLTTLDVDADVELGGDLDVVDLINGLIIKAVGTNNIIIGNVDTLSSLDTGDENFAFGPGAGENLNTGRFNILMGTDAGNMITDATSNMLIGFQAGRLLNNSSNVGIGNNALTNVNAGSGSNIGIGASALRGASGGCSSSQTIAIGTSAGQDLTSGAGQTFIGHQAGANVTSGPFNTFIGHQAGDLTTTGRENIVIGRGYDASAADADHELNIGGVLVGFNASHATPGLNVVGFLTAGDGTNELQVSATGDLSFGGGGGFIEGHMTIPAVDIVVDTSATANPVEVADDGTGVPDAGDGWALVYQNEVTFAVSDLHYQTVTIAGTYKVIWDMSPKTDAGGGTIIHGGIMIDGVAVRDNGEGHAHIFNANDNIQINGVGVIDCPNGNEEISLWISNNVNQKTVIEHGNMNIQLIGGT